ncbi:unnamed protein product [Arabidopsis lyrata]|nr:unnamed protein product [Arabidopsis lyrata]
MERLAKLGQISKNIENEFILLTPKLKNVGLAKLMGDVTTELQNLSLETMSFGEDEEKKGKDISLMNDLSNFMKEALDKLKKGEFVNFKQVFMIKSLSSNLTSKKLKWLRLSLLCLETLVSKLSIVLRMRQKRQATLVYLDKRSNLMKKSLMFSATC